MKSLDNPKYYLNREFMALEFNDRVLQLAENVVRLEIDHDCPEDIINFLLHKYHLRYDDVYRCNGPVNLQRLIWLIEQCQNAASKGQESRIILKANGLTDDKIIQALYLASQKGAHITLIVRGTCCLKPKIPGVSENIQVISIVGRFLEHHRVYYFKFANEEYYYCSSADLMERNLYARIEIMFPILSEACQKRVYDEILKNYLKDNTNTWELQSDGHYKPIRDGEYSCQNKLLELYKAC